MPNEQTRSTAKPTESAEPDKLTESAEPDKPTESAEPDELTQPAKTNKLTQSAGRPRRWWRRGSAGTCPNYAPKEMILDRGEGARLWDLDGNEYVDLGAGISVTSLGHGDPELAEALATQAGRLWHVSNLYFAEPVVRLAEELCEASFADRVFFCNSGAEANEAAIKLARKHASLRHGEEKHEIVTFHGGFHGRTIATVTATAQPKYQEGFGPMPGGFRYCDYNDVAALDEAIGERTCAVLVEPVQGEGGSFRPRTAFLPRSPSAAGAHDALVMFDEIQSGLARTGRLFAYQWEEGVVPDVVTNREGARRRPAHRRDAGRPRGGRDPPAGQPRLDVRRETPLRRRWHGWWCASCARRSCSPTSSAGARGCASRLVALHNEIGCISEVRGKGLMIGAVLRDEWAGRAAELGEVCRRHGVLVLQAGPDVVRFLPPLNITDAELDDGMDRFEAAMREAAEDERGTASD